MKKNNVWLLKVSLEDQHVRRETSELVILAG